MQVRGFVWSQEVQGKVAEKHRLSRTEVEEAFHGPNRVRRVRRRTYGLYGRSEAGRYIMVLFGFRGGLAYIASARDMEPDERRYYRRELN